MTAALSQPEVVHYGGRECLAVHVEQASYRPDPSWMPEEVWNRFLARSGVDDVARAHIFHGAGPFNPTIGCQCGSGVHAVVTPFTVSKEITIRIIMGQCPTCRLIHWGQVKNSRQSVRFAATPTVGSMGTRLIEGPPRRFR